MADPDPIVVDPKYLHELARIQRDAAGNVVDYTTDIGFGDDIAWSHGVYVRLGVNGIWDAIEARKRAGEALAKLFNHTADELDKGGTMYAGTDDAQGRDLDKHMQDG
ncbi:MAG: type VII secretion target [Mycobacteriaceae bacterium]